MGNILSSLPDLSQFTKYLWWMTPEEALQNPVRLLAQVMNLGTLEDWIYLEKNLSREQRIEVLLLAQPGWFRLCSWSFCHARLGIESPDLPERSFGDD